MHIFPLKYALCLDHNALITKEIGELSANAALMYGEVVRYIFSITQTEILAKGLQPMNDLYSGGILGDLYRGDLHPQDRDVDPRSEYAAFQRILADNERKLTAFLETTAGADEERRLLSQLLNARQETAVCDELDRFIEGFRLGARMMADTFLLPQERRSRDIL